MEYSFHNWAGAAQTLLPALIVSKSVSDPLQVTNYSPAFKLSPSGVVWQDSRCSAAILWKVLGRTTLPGPAKLHLHSKNTLYYIHSSEPPTFLRIPSVRGKSLQFLLVNHEDVSLILTCLILTYSILTCSRAELTDVCHPIHKNVSIGPRSLCSGNLTVKKKYYMKKYPIVETSVSVDKENL